MLQERDYALVVRGAMRDAEGRTLGKDVVKKFRTSAEDRQRTELAAWKITTPPSGTRDPVTVRLPKSFDHKGLGRFVTIHRGADRLEGKIALGAGEQTWSFEPASPWQAADYELRVDGRLEDVAGNTPRRPFDMDLKASAPPPQRLDIMFRPR